MAYHGYLPLVKQHLNRFERPTVLEIGVCKGVSFLTLATWLVRFKQQSGIIGVDIKIQEAVQIMAANLDRNENQTVQLWEGNSLEILPKMVENKFKFDLILIDGDHNYSTVSQELQHLNALSHDATLVLIDDYHGRWSERDLWYGEKEDYADCKIATKRQETEKHGVKPAVDEYVAANPEWNTYVPIKGEPLMLSREELNIQIGDKQ